VDVELSKKSTRPLDVESEIVRVHDYRADVGDE
jgi:hypothetical protein